MCSGTSVDNCVMRCLKIAIDCSVGECISFCASCPYCSVAFIFFGADWRLSALCPLSNHWTARYDQCYFWRLVLNVYRCWCFVCLLASERATKMLVARDIWCFFICWLCYAVFIMTTLTLGILLVMCRSCSRWSRSAVSFCLSFAATLQYFVRFYAFATQQYQRYYVFGAFFDTGTFKSIFYFNFFTFILNCTCNLYWI